MKSLPVVVASLLAVVSLSSCGGRVAEDASGAEIYTVSCARCHGADLAGNGVFPAVGAGSPAEEKEDAALLQTIARGRGSMPSFEGQLTDAQIERVLDYLREQQDL